MTDFGDNTIQPLAIEDARAAAHRASELQRTVEDSMRAASRDLAEKERVYREQLSLRIVELKAEGVAWTVCGDIARGEEKTAHLRRDRDIAEGVLDAARQQAFRYGADRRDLSQMIEWSTRRELRIDIPPIQYDPATGEVRPPLRSAA